MHLDEIDGELHILDENLDVVHVFERARSSDGNGEVTLSRAAYKHMCAWVKNLYNNNVANSNLWVYINNTPVVLRVKQSLDWIPNKWIFTAAS
jgi:hypothetical protein